ncbi:MAG: sulfite exporter TauE/SafE family protein [Chloroflexia bacterium]
MKPILRLVLVLFAVTGLVFVSSPRSASAHPMGNFSVNKYSALSVSTDRVTIQYIVDMAEIPAFQELGTITSTRGADPTAAEREAYSSRKSAELLKALGLKLNGSPLALSLERTALSFPPGNGGLPTLRLEMDLFALLPASARGTLNYEDNTFAGRIGWHEIIAIPGTGITLEESSVPSVDQSKSLTVYNPDLLNSAPSVIAASVKFAPGVTTSGVNSATSSTQPAQADFLVGEFEWVQQQTIALTSVISQDDLPLAALLVAVMIAFLAGAAHALSPGHGKAVVAAYMVGSRGTPLHAFILGATITFSHTIGVFLLGFVVLALADYILPETLYPWLKFSSGILLAFLGVTLFVQRFRAWRRSTVAAQPIESSHAHAHEHGLAHTHDDPAHGHDHHEHDHSVPHKHGLFSKPHTHMPTDGEQVTMGGLLALGITGGIIPCPSALMVLLVAVQFGKVALGLLLILAFSLGLALVISVIGLLMVYSRTLLNKAKFNSGLLLRLPMVSALAVSCLGIFLALGAFGS